ncbi:MAG: hypothetical protein IBV52_01570 [Candidatus Bathyarchaeota archaeon]
MAKPYETLRRLIHEEARRVLELMGLMLWVSYTRKKMVNVCIEYVVLLYV